MLKNKTLWMAAVAALALLAAACGSGDDGPDAATLEDAVGTYAAGVHAAYGESLASAQEMDAAIDAFLADPSDATLAAAKDAWLVARDDYGPTEAFRFYGGPIDDEETGTEGLINAWPLDEAYIDYVEGNAEAGIVNDPDGFPTIDAELLVSLNEQGGEANISTGWHAIEFLLWGQDLSLDGPGQRPASDYTTAANADRRATYLAVASDLLVSHLSELVDTWAPDADNYRAEFEALESEEALRRIITGIGELSRGELAGERMNVAYAERSQEDEHSCFSDNTTADIVGNARGDRHGPHRPVPRAVCLALASSTWSKKQIRISPISCAARWMRACRRSRRFRPRSISISLTVFPMTILAGWRCWRGSRPSRPRPTRSSLGPRPSV